MNIIGKSTNGKYVVDSVFKLTDTVGLPLDIVVEELRDRDLIPAWDCYVRDAREAGWLDWTIYQALQQQGLEDCRVRALMKRTCTILHIASE